MTVRHGVGPVVWRLVFALLLTLALAAPAAQPARADAHDEGPSAGGASDEAPQEGPVAVGLERADPDRPVVAGGAPVSYTITLHNTGTTDLVSPSISYQVPRGATASVDGPAPWTCGLARTADAEDSMYCQLEVLGPDEHAPPIAMDLTIDEDAADEIENVVEAKADDTEPVEATETTSVQREAELSVTKTDDVEDTVGFGGESFSWTIGITNDGPSAARNVTLSDDLPPSVTVTGVSVPEPWTCVLPAEGEANGSLFCTLPALGAGASAPEIVITVRVGEDVSGEIRNVAVVDSDDTDPAEDSETTIVDVETVVAGVVLEKPAPSPAPAEAAATAEAPAADVTAAQVDSSEELAATGLVAEQLVPVVVLLLGLGAGLLLLAGRLSEQR